MPLQGMQLLTGATLSATGGTAITYTTDNKTVANGLHLIDASESNFIVRPNILVKTKDPVKMPDGSYTKDRKSIVIFEPFIDSTGKTHLNLIRVEREVHPETDAADALDLLKKGGQVCFDTDTTAFFASGSLA
jgi:hypothetical protein